MKKRIDALEQHVIVCGYGHVGQHVCADLLGAGVPVVVIDRRGRPRCGRPRRGRSRPCWATRPWTPRCARGHRARPRADRGRRHRRRQRPHHHDRASAASRRCRSCRAPRTTATVPKLLRAGATRTVSPHAIAGGRMAQAVLRPAVLDFIEDATGKGHPDLQMEEQLVRPGSPLDGKTVGTSGLRSRRGADPRRHQAPRRAAWPSTPSDDAPVAAGDTLITLGSREQLGRADALALH